MTGSGPAASYGSNQVSLSKRRGHMVETLHSLQPCNQDLSSMLPGEECWPISQNEQSCPSCLIVGRLSFEIKIENVIVPTEVLTTKFYFLHCNIALCKSGISVLTSVVHFLLVQSKQYSVSCKPGLGIFLIRPVFTETTDDVIYIFWDETWRGAQSSCRYESTTNTNCLSEHSWNNRTCTAFTSW